MATSALLGLSIHATPPLITFLRLTPLLSATASLTHAYMELITTSSFLSPPPTTSFTTTQFMQIPPPNPTSPAISNAAYLSQLEDAREKVLPAWFVNFFNSGVWSVIGLNSISTLSAVANVFLFPTGLGPYRTYYIAGLVAALGHYIGVPFVAKSVDGLARTCVRQVNCEEIGSQRKEKGQASRWLSEWVGYHKIRMATVDVFALASFGIGVIGVLSGGSS
ncbi:hypothetical protein CC78DRAFT_612616 [Lojkania enalia]|uniref:Uncharacterized protein n=1 Tax=Lojkania enalia TaxID=147567 RepID=A0A9P4N9L7_9PLEO|nr:hypothetical protein CC78DRAFT_612616 [Didymosphaeria enalia]